MPLASFFNAGRYAHGRSTGGVPAVGVTSMAGVGVAVRVGVPGREVGVFDGVRVGEAVRVAEGVTGTVAVRVGDGVRVAVAVAVGVTVGAPPKIDTGSDALNRLPALSRNATVYR